jgi:hypothetical protein
MNKKILSLLLLSLGMAVSMRAQTVLTNNIVQIDVSNGEVSATFTLTSAGGSYSSPPTVTLTGGGGTGATAHAVMTPDGSAVESVVLDTPGSGYIGAPAVTFSGGGTPAEPPEQATATAELDFPPGSIFNSPYQNEVYGPAGRTIGIVSLASGTQPAAGFTYQFTANGSSIGQTPEPAPPGTPSGIVFDPPLPGVYSFVSTTSDGNGNTAVSPAVRYFATGTAIVSPEASGTPGGGGQNGSGIGTLVPVGSSIVLRAVSGAADGFASKINFYTDWNGTSGTLIGTGANNSFVIYTPAGAAGTSHLIKAIGYDNTGAAIPTINNTDEVTVTMATANPAGLPQSVINSPTNGALLQIPQAGGASGSGIPVIVTAGAQGDATISKVELYINGVLTDTDTAYPYTFNWTPTVTGVFTLTALTYDSVGNVVASAPDTVSIEGAPSIAITSPADGGTINSGANTQVSAVATDIDLNSSGQPATITQVQFFQDGVYVGSATTPTNGDVYTITFKPTQNIVNGVVAPSLIYAQATDSLGFTGTSPKITVNVTSGGTGSNIVVGTPPTVTLTSPTSAVVNSPVTLSATASAPNGNVAEVDFLVDGVIVKSLTSYPYSTTYTFTNLGTYTVAAAVTDNLGDKVTTTSTQITIVTEPPPTVAISSPSSGGIVTTGTGVTVTAAANSPSGTIASVQFFENGISIGTATTPPYTATFTPLSAGLYTLTAIATDSAGETTTSGPTIVEAEPTQSGLGTTTYFGQYQGLTDGGRFAFIVVDGKYGTYIAHSNSGPATNTLNTDLTVTPAGSFSSTKLTGSASGAGVSGSLVPSGDLFIGAATATGVSQQGYYTGSITGSPTSQVTAIVGGDGSLMAYITNGTTSDVADGAVDSTGAFTITTTGNNTFSGTIDPTSALLTATLSGSAGGTILGGRVSGGTFSDGVLRNLSTRGQVGTGANLMVAGFVVGGSSPKQLLIRAVGPTLSTFGLSGTLSAASLQVFKGTTLVASNTGWSSTSANQTTVNAADLQVGAFALPAGSADSALVTTLAPGAYTAQITGGAGGATGLALAEVYDMDAFTPFTAQRLINVSTRGEVNNGNAVLIGGFSFNGTAPKRLLIRAAGPGLTAMSVTNALSAAHLQLYNSSQQLIRENFDWQAGNDSGLVAEAEAAAGAFAFANGSADSVILITLPPGTYTAVVSGATTADTGTGLVEVYEVP